MNRYDNYYIFRNAKMDDQIKIMSFLNTFWDNNHILANDKEFFLYHFKGHNDDIHMYLMEDRESKEILGVVGYVLYSEDPRRRFFSGSISKIRPDVKVPQAGLEIMKRLHDFLSPAVELACGANPRTIVPLFNKVFGYKTGVMSQYFLKNLKMDKYNIITVPRGIKQCAPVTLDGIQLRRIYSAEDCNLDFNQYDERLPYRSKEYIQKRYFDHPIFDYQNYSLELEGDSKGIIFTRIISKGESRISLIVDYVGKVDYFLYIGNGLQEILQDQNIECFSFLQEGIDEILLRRAGFLNVLDDSRIIVPTYFEPFLNENIENYYIKENYNLIVFKGYGDQDNPKYSSQSGKL